MRRPRRRRRWLVVTVVAAMVGLTGGVGGVVVGQQGWRLGKILRIEPAPEAPEPYRVPADNPFARRPRARQQVFADGLARRRRG